MTVTNILDRLLHQDLPRSVEIFCPEMLVATTIVAMLVARISGLDRRVPTCWIALFGALAAFTAVFAQFTFLKLPDATAPLSMLFGVFRLSADGAGTAGAYFSEMLMHDALAVFFRLGLLLFLVLMVALTVLSGIPDQEDGADFYTLLFGATLGMLLAAGVNNLLMLFLSIEMMSVPSYAMVGFLKGRRTSSEAALKYVVYGAGTAGVMLFGLSLLAGLLGTTSFPELAPRFATLLDGQSFSMSNPNVVVLMLGLAMVLVGVAFKLSLVPFHFWCPDAFDGASAEVGAFLSVASKAAVFGLLLRFVTAFTGPTESLQELSRHIGAGLAVAAAVSMTFGNLAAYTQTSLKRLLAYSTIAHAGYMVLGVAAMLLIANAPAGAALDAAEIVQESRISVEGLVYYLAVYLFMNLSAFAIVAGVRNETFREDLDAYNGLIYEGTATKVLCVCLLMSLISLVGIPPFGGFFAKLAIFRAAYVAGYVNPLLWGVLIVAGVNTVISLFYYLRVLKAVFIAAPPPGRRPLQTPDIFGAYVALITVPILLLGASPLQGRLSETARAVAASLFP